MTKKQKKMLRRILISAAIFVAAALLGLIIAMPWFVALPIYLAGYLIVGHDVVVKAIKKILNGQLFDEEFLMTLATFGAFLSGEFAEGMMVMLLFQIGEPRMISS